ncbi:hypothetical protein WICPIJ_001851 [Wickerhamomyces pijperi]|uniref:Uncharacterized protein n=1 Tax=Wickerhamomyces pijperi TaxID=599730 RepID=A0A9P8TQ71_WICPI|nr:hypothetical protein WICPIJ_001851 [Wickerhamomyces pijperi]
MRFQANEPNLFPYSIKPQPTQLSKTHSIMSDDEGLEDYSNWDYPKKFSAYIDTVIERNDYKLNPLIKKYGKDDIFHDFKEATMPDLNKVDEKERWANLEFASYETFSDMLIYADHEEQGEEEKTLIKIGLFLDFVIVLKEEGIAYYDIVVLLTAKIIKGLSTQMLLPFMDALFLRTEELKNLTKVEKLDVYAKAGTPLTWNTCKYYSKWLLMNVNYQIMKAANSLDNNMSLLVYELLRFTSDVFPPFSEVLINKSWEIKDTYADKLPEHTSSSELFNCYLLLQKLSRDPLCAEKEKLVEIRLEKLAHLVCRTETEENKKSPPKHYSNSKEIYECHGNSEEYSQTLKKYYQEKHFVPVLNISESNFLEKLRTDQFFRRSLMIQISILLTILSPRPHVVTAFSKGNTRNMLKFQLKGNSQKFANIRIHIQDVLKQTDKSFLFTLNQINDISERSWIMRKAEDFKFATDLYEALNIDDTFHEKFENIKKLPTRYFSKLGTKEITNHWRISVGLERLKKLEYDYDLKGITAQLEKLYAQTKENQETALLNTWKAYRMIRKSNLAKFKQIDQYTGLEGYFDAELKPKLTAERVILEEKQRAKDEELAKEREEQRRAKEEEQKRAEVRDAVNLRGKRKFEDENGSKSDNESRKRATPNNPPDRERETKNEVLEY